MALIITQHAPKSKHNQPRTALKSGALHWDPIRSDPRFQQTAEEGGAGGVMVRERAILRSA